MKQVLAGLCTAALLTGCGAMPGMPGTVTQEKSTFDGSNIVAVKPANAGTYGLAMGASWRSSAPEYVQILVEWLGDYAAIQDKAGLEFNVDGKIIRLDSVGLPTQFSSTQGPGSVTFKTSAKAFVMRRDDFQSLINAKSLKARLNTLSGSVETDMLQQDMPLTAIRGFKDFAARLP
jgi:hypothetical protein